VTALALALVLSQRPPVVGDRVAQFELPSLEGPIVAWEPGRTTVVCAFAYWCDTWKEQSERLLEAQTRLLGRGVEFLAVSVDGKWSEVDKKPAWSQRLLDVGGSWSQRIGVDRVPYTIVVSPEGKVVWSSPGIVRPDDLVAAVERAGLAEEPGERALYLTFDDFPAASGNERLLDALRALEVKATFFVVGESALGQEPLLRRAQDEGHTLAVHAWRHETTGSEPERCRAWLKEAIGTDPRWLRRVGSNKVEEFSGEALRLPVVDPYDYKRPGLAELARRTIPRLKPGAVVQLHAGVEESVAFLPELVARARELGYRFEPLPR
jgi:peptidoglycan/xylan/chitin deacetylase (PgdA/CDA1 family)